MRIIVALPFLLHVKEVLDMLAKHDGTLLSVGPFCPDDEPDGQTLNVFPRQMALLPKMPKNFWSLNLPHWGLEKNKTCGVAGPGLPHEELFWPAYVGKALKGVAGQYDKWRPYPAEKYNSYTFGMARKFAYKRCRMLERIVREMPCGTLFYVEHSTASIPQLEPSITIADKVISKVIEAVGSQPSVELTVFSPYGGEGTLGFVASSHMQSKDLSNWELMRKYIANE